MSEQFNYNRRRFFGAAAMTVAAAQLGTLDSANAQSGNAETPRSGAQASFSSLKQLDAGLLNVGYAEAGPANGPPVILLHGWPYDIYSYVDVAPLLAAQGFRVIVPFLRGCGSTTFLSGATFRNGEQAVFPVDVIAFMDALKIDKAVFGGFDWAARPPTSSPRSGRSVARPWFRLAATCPAVARPTSCLCRP